MEKVEPKDRQRILEGGCLLILPLSAILLISVNTPLPWRLRLQLFIFMSIVIHGASWEHLARSLYRHHQVAAVEEVRSYLPPKGEPGCGVHVSIVCTIILSWFALGY